MLTEHAEIYLGNEANCPSIEESDGSTNMTIADVSGVFLVLGVFIGLSVLSWLMRRSPPAKKRKARQMAQRKLNSPQGEDNVTATFAKLSRRQQKSFAFEAAVKLLAETEAAKSGRPNGSSASGISRTDADVEAGAVCGDTSAEDSERRRSRETAREIAAGRPVLRIGGGRQSERDSGIRQRYRRTDRLGDVGPRGRVSDDNAGSGLDVARVRRPRGGGAGDDLVNVGPMLGFNTSSIRGDVFPDSSGWDLRRANNNGRRVGPMLGFNTSSVRGDLSPDSPRWDLRRARNNGSRHGVMALLRRLFSAKSQRSSPSPAAEGLPASRDHIGHSPATAHDATAVTAAASKWLARRTAPVQLSTSSSAADFARVEGDPPPVGAALAAADAIVRGDDTASSSVANSGSGLSRPPGTVAAAPAESSGGKVLASERASMAGATSTADGMPGMPSGDATVTTVEGQKGLNTITTSVPGLPTPASPPTPSADAAATAARAATGSPREEVDVATAR